MTGFRDYATRKSLEQFGYAPQPKADLAAINDNLTHCCNTWATSRCESRRSAPAGAHASTSASCCSVESTNDIVGIVSFSNVDNLIDPRWDLMVTARSRAPKRD
jgi:hypothetical protein